MHARHTDEIRLPFDGVHSRAAPRRACEIPIAPGPDPSKQQDYYCRGGGKSGKAPLETARGWLHPPENTCAASNSTAVSVGTARDTLPQMIFHNQRASRRQLVVMKSWKKRTNIGATTNRLQRTCRGFLAFRCPQLLPHAFSGHS